MEAGSRPFTSTANCPAFVVDAFLAHKFCRHFLKIMDASTPGMLPLSTRITSYHPLTVIILGSTGAINNPVLYTSLHVELSESLFIKALPFDPHCPIGANQVLHMKLIIHPVIIQELLSLKMAKDQVLVVEQYSHLLQYGTIS